MAKQTAFVGNLFLVRWGTPSIATCTEISMAFKARGRREKPGCIVILPADLPELTPHQARLIIERTQDLLPLCKHVGIVVEAGGERGAAHRKLTTRVKLASSRDYSLSVVSTIESALRWAPGPLAEEAELRMAFASVGYELPDVLPPCVPRTAKVA